MHARAPHRRSGRLSLGVAIAALAMLAAGTLPPAVAGPAQARGSTAQARGASAGATGSWVLRAHDPSAVTDAPPYIGNGFIGTRVPAAGAGFVATPVATETHAAGVWADIRDLAHDAPQPEGAVNLPGWTTLRFSDGTATY
ncbi:MAG TPA: hypothetical protein VFG63_09475, partial [Nocardioidaceae bacterium]|nr:hypothetical protein [Nocardioidaceae bacterium]